ncbi:MAG: hypothetical protein ABIG94_13555 [Pseudomonadota bacterium]
METEEKKSILNDYLGRYPAWFDQRKKEILKDNIDIIQWQINMNYLIDNYGTIDPSEEKAFSKWTKTFEYLNDDFLENNVTKVLLHIMGSDLPPILDQNKDRNWFLAAYPDVFEYFFPQFNLSANDFEAEKRPIKEQIAETHFERMQQYIYAGKGNQTIYLIRIKNVYKKELLNTFLLSR